MADSVVFLIAALITLSLWLASTPGLHRNRRRKMRSRLMWIVVPIGLSFLMKAERETQARAEMTDEERARYKPEEVAAVAALKKVGARFRLDPGGQVIALDLNRSNVRDSDLMH